MGVLRRRWRGRAWLLVGFAAACGGAVMGGGIAGTSSVVAPISGFGSVIVGGIEFDTSAAQIAIEGDPASASDLKLGMVAAVRGTVDARRTRGVAERIAVEHLALGPLDAVDVSSATLGLLGQQVLTDAATVFDPAPLTALRVGDIVELWGFVAASGTYRATRVTRRPDVPELDLRGNVRDLDAATSTFRLGSLTVDYSSALLDNLPPGGLRNGLLVEVAADAPPAGGVLVASNVEGVNPALLPDEGEGLKVEGFVTQLVSSREVVVNGGQRVRLTADTRYVHGTASDLVVAAHVDVDGVADGDGALLATKVDFLSPGG